MIEGSGVFDDGDRIHLVGIGGVGMEALGRYLHALGGCVSGSDIEASDALDKLRSDGISAHVGHESQHVEGADIVVHSAAVPPDNVELEAARCSGVPVVSRARFLARTTRGHRCVAVAGTHGKTTTASMLAAVLDEAGLEPSVIIGGWVDGRAQAAAGSGDLFVVEADEFDRSFLHLQPQLALVTNVEAEHVGEGGSYRDLDELLQAFSDFLHRLPSDGLAVVNGDDAGTRRISPLLERPTTTFGLSPASDVEVAQIELRERGSSCQLRLDASTVGQLELAVPGVHNVINAAAAAAAAHGLEVPFEAIRSGLAGFRGVDRRFQIVGEVSGMLVIDDYAHHPTEVTATLATARRWGRRVVAVFQPHLYSRTRLHAARFGAALTAADAVLLAPVYGSREEPEPGVDSGLIADAMRRQGFDDVECVSTMEEVPRRLADTALAGDLIITLGAGDIGEVAHAFVANLN